MTTKGFLGFFVFLCLFAVSASFAADMNRTFTVRFGQDRLRAEQRYVADQTYDLLAMDDLQLIRELGQPCLPVKIFNVYVPRGSRIKQVRVESVKTSPVGGQYLLLPGQEEAPLSGDIIPDPVAPDERIYAQADPYPGSPVRLSSHGSIGGRKICAIQVFPMQYLPARREVVFIDQVSFAVEFEDAWQEPRVPMETPSVRRLRNSIVSKLVENTEDLEQDFPGEAGTLDPSAATEYLIICHPNHIDEYQALKDWKTRKGVPAAIVDRDEILATYPGRDDPEKLRNCIMDYYLNQSTVWVLMTMAAPKARIRGCYCSVGGTVDQAIPGDIYFADMDGDWNLDNDSLWGETGDDVDLYTDVYVGRLPENTGAQALIAINKVLTYEGFYSLPTDYQQEMLFLAEYADEYTDCAIAKNMIDNESVPAQFDPITKLYESSGNLNKASAMNALNSGMGVVNHCGHGNANVLSIGPSALYSEDMMALTNAPRYSVFYTLACIPGNYENPMGCFGRSFIEAPQGGGFFVGNSRYGWYWPGNPGYGTGELYDREFFESMYVRDYDHLGVIHADAKIQRIPWSGSNGTDRWTQFTSNLLGDPETPVWKHTPLEMSATHPESLLIGNHMLTIQVSSGGSPVAQARVCLWKDDEVYLVDETDASGSVQFQFSVTDSGDILLTATKNDYLPYMGDIAVGGSLSGLTSQDRTRKLAVAVSPNPVTASATIRYQLPARSAAGSKAAIRIYDAAGRLIRDLPVVGGAGGSSLVWDGRLQGGAKAPAGIYFLKMSCGEVSALTKFVVLR